VLSLFAGPASDRRFHCLERDWRRGRRNNAFKASYVSRGGANEKGVAACLFENQTVASIYPQGSAYFGGQSDLTLAG
jgi:hypothetical protein